MCFSTFAHSSVLHTFWLCSQVAFVTCVSDNPSGITYLILFIDKTRWESFQIEVHKLRTKQLAWNLKCKVNKSFIIV